MVTCACFASAIPGPPGPQGEIGPVGPPGPPVTITGLDTTCIDVTVSGDPGSGFVISAVPIIAAECNGLECSGSGLLVAPSADANNALTCGTDGRLFVSTSAVSVDTDTTDCIDMSISGAGSPVDPFVISAVPILDPAADNLLSCGAAGLYVPPTVLSELDTPCIEVTITGTGTLADPYVISADPVIDPAVDNQLTCGPTGLYVPPTDVTFVGADTNTVDLTLVEGPPGTFNVQADVIVDPDPTNILVANPTGLYVPDCSTPVGGIILWFGNAGSVPTGWEICDGANGTPDLRDRIPVGAGPTFPQGSIGGSTAGVGLHAHSLSGHTHAGTTGVENQNHTHGGSTGLETNDHAHCGTTAGQTADHAHGMTFNGDHNHNPNGAGGGDWAVRHPAGANGLVGGPLERATFTSMANAGGHTHGIFGATNDHAHGFCTAGVTANHAHNFTTGGISANHNHNVTTGAPDIDATSDAGEATGNMPPYLALHYIMKTVAC